MKLNRYIVLLAILMVALIAIIVSVGHLISTDWASLTIARWNVAAITRVAQEFGAGPSKPVTFRDTQAAN